MMIRFSDSVKWKSRWVFPNGGDFFSKVDADRTPRDAATATDAAGRAELIYPRCQFVSHPLAIAIACVVSHDAAVHVTEFEIETGIPLPLTLDMFTGQIADFGDGAAKTRRADHGAVRARQTAVGDIVPARVFEVGQQQVMNIGDVHPFGNLIDGVLPRGLCCLSFFFAGLLGRKLVNNRLTLFGAGFHHESVV